MLTYSRRRFVCVCVSCTGSESGVSVSRDHLYTSAPLHVQVVSCSILSNKCNAMIAVCVSCLNISVLVLCYATVFVLDLQELLRYAAILQSKKKSHGG